MNKKIIITLIISLFIGGISSVLVIRFLSKKHDSLKVKEEEKKEKAKEEIKSKEKEKEKEKEEEITDIPWLYNWKGELLFFITSAVIALIVSLIAIMTSEDKIDEVANKNKLTEDFSYYTITHGDNKQKFQITVFFILFSIFFFIFEVLVSPFIIAFKKIGKKSYFQCLLKTLSLRRLITDVLIFIAVIIYNRYAHKRYNLHFNIFSNNSQKGKNVKQSSILSIFNFFNIHYYFKKSEPQKIPKKNLKEKIPEFLNTEFKKKVKEEEENEEEENEEPKE